MASSRSSPAWKLFSVLARRRVWAHTGFFREGSSLCGGNEPSEAALRGPWSGARSAGRETLGACFNLVVLKCSAAIKQLQIKQNQSLGLVGQARQTRGDKLFPTGNARAGIGNGDGWLPFLAVVSRFKAEEFHAEEMNPCGRWISGQVRRGRRNSRQRVSCALPVPPSQGIPSSPCLSRVLSSQHYSLVLMLPFPGSRSSLMEGSGSCETSVGSLLGLIWGTTTRSRGNSCRPWAALEEGFGAGTGARME